MSAPAADPTTALSVQALILVHDDLLREMRAQIEGLRAQVEALQPSKQKKAHCPQCAGSLGSGIYYLPAARPEDRAQVCRDCWMKNHLDA